MFFAVVMITFQGQHTQESYIDSMQNRDLLQELPNSMNREKRPLDTDVLVEFEKKPFEVQDFRKFTNRFVESTEE